MRTIDSVNFSNKKVLIRVDFNVPLDENNRVTDHTRIKAAKPTIDKVLADGGSCVLMTHLGRPKGVDDSLSLRHIVSETQKVLGVDIQFSKHTIGRSRSAGASITTRPGYVVGKSPVL